MLLHNAVEYADLEPVQLLVKHGADLNAKDNAGRTRSKWPRLFQF